MSYLRVIPRDLFNEAKLLKCMGALYIAAEHLDPDEAVITLEHEADEPFTIEQNPSDGSIFVGNVSVWAACKRVKRRLHCYTGMNARDAYPLYADHGDETVKVFDDDGKFSDEFIAMITKDHDYDDEGGYHHSDPGRERFHSDHGK